METQTNEADQDGIIDSERASSSNLTRGQATLHSTSKNGNIQTDPAHRSADGDGKPPENDWEDEKVIEGAALQAMVDRLHDKGEKEVARVLKVRSSFHQNQEMAMLIYIGLRPSSMTSD